MGQSREEESIYKKHQELCADLNMDKDAADEAWQSYESIRQNYSLEGDQLHWLGCALYVACRKSTTPTVGRSSNVEGNLVSLTRLLRLCNLSLIQFFNKSKKWADMASLPPDFRDKIVRLERNFAVSMVIFKKFQPIFADMFAVPSNDAPRQTKSKKQRNLPCSSGRVFDFAWTLFVCVKADFPDISDDLVNSYHLLLACCDLIFSNVLLSDRRDLLNPKFSGLPRNFNDDDYIPPKDPPCIIYHLCEKHDGILVEAKGIKEYCWKNHIKKLFEKKVLRGDVNNFSGLIDISTFDQNIKAINKAYEEYVLSVGDFDERIFLGDDANIEIGTPTKIVGQSGIGDFTERIQAKRNLSHQLQQQLTPSTPLTGRKYLKSKEPSNVTPVSTATQSVSRLQTLLSGRQAAPSPILQQIILSCQENPHIEERVKEMGQRFCAHYTQSVEHPGTLDFAQKRLQLAETLYYKLLESILSEEMKKPTFDYNGLLMHEIFHQTLFACCLEIVIYSYNSQRTFPWVLDALGIEPYHFYKVIEIIVRTEDQLSRDMVKHLNLIEEQILESLAWKSDSPLWENLSNSGLPVPSCEDVLLPGQLSTEDTSMVGPTPLSNPAIRRLVNMPGTQSPGPSASERFQSPVSSGLAKKRLFMEASSFTRTVKPGQSLLNTQQQASIAAAAMTTTATLATASTITTTTTVPAGAPQTASSNTSTKIVTCTMNLPTIEAEDGKRYIPIAISPNSGSVIIQTPTQTQSSQKEKRPKRTGSLGLFFRKFYHLASVRMQELCNHLDLKETELRRKIWTCFEHSIVEHTDLMLDRHLDQILMCAVYVICKIVGPEKPFTDVMKCYRYQPQSSSHVYRSVLLASKHRRTSNSSTCSPVPSENNAESNERIRSSSTLPVMKTETAGQSSSGSSTYENEDRCDIIKFYNTVYVKKVQSFVRKFTAKGQQNENLTLSPLPVGKSVPVSPRRRVSDKHSVYIRALTSNDPKVFPPSPTKPLSYCFSRSPAKDLQAINIMVQHEVRRIGKRLLNDDGPDSEKDGASPPKQHTGVVTRKVQDLFVDRLVAKSQD